VRRIRELGGRVRYDFECRKGMSPPPYLAARLFGVDFCATAEEVVFPEGMANDAAMREIGGLRLKDLKVLSVAGSPITDAGLEHFRSLKQLRTLDLEGTSITDAGLGSLDGLDGLQHLYLDSTEVTDSGLENLGPLRGLQSLSLCGTDVTEAGLARLSLLPQLKVIFIDGTGAGHLDRVRAERALPSCTVVVE
jgi:hypothetical protein